MSTVDARSKFGDECHQHENDADARKNLGQVTEIIQAKSVGKSQPLTTAEQCPSSLKPAALIACLQPDRRIEIAIQGSKD